MKNLYLVFTIVFLSLSLAGGLFLVNQVQDTRNRAAGCYPEDENHCKGTWFTLAGVGTCAGTKTCTADEMPTPRPDATCTKEQCDIGAQMCQGAPNAQTGYQCNCVCGQYNGKTNVTVWQCSNNYNPGTCPPASGQPAGGSKGSIVCRKDNSSICPNTHSSNASFDAMVGMFVGDPASCSYYDACGRPLSAGQSCVGLSRLSNGEPNHGAFVGCSGNQNCFCDLNFSGTVKCYDDAGNDSCGAGIPAPTLPPKSTNTPTPKPSATPIPSNTPKPTPTQTPSPTNTPAPTGTPQPTNTPTPTQTPSPTNTPAPTGTPQPTNTPTHVPTNTPTKVVAQGPSPTRIILPVAGVEFPVQALTVLGVIVTLAGFLILL